MYDYSCIVLTGGIRNYGLQAHKLKRYYLLSAQHRSYTSWWQETNYLLFLLR